jgi:dihydrofolate reductase
VKLAVIAAIGRNRVIGHHGALPWHIPQDLKRFKQLTTGHAVLMGRRTFESLGKPLARRRNVVVTSRTIPGVETYHSVNAALQALAGEEKVFVIGGTRLFAQFLHEADELYFTFVHRDAEGDTFFPNYEEVIHHRFTESHREEHGDFTFVDYLRRT